MFDYLLYTTKEKENLNFSVHILSPPGEKVENKTTQSTKKTDV